MERSRFLFAYSSRYEVMIEIIEVDEGFGIAFDAEGFMDEYLAKLARYARRFAVSISPVVTGSYRDAHEVFFRGGTAILRIDPRATNRGQPVERYAANVEDIHKVYFRTEIYAESVKNRMVVNYGN